MRTDEKLKLLAADKDVSFSITTRGHVWVFKFGLERHEKVSLENPNALQEGLSELLDMVA